MTTGSARWLRLRTAAVGVCALAAFGTAFLPAQSASATQLDFSQHGVTTVAAPHSGHGTQSPTSGSTTSSVPSGTTSVDTKPAAGPVHDHTSPPGLAKTKPHDSVGSPSQPVDNGSGSRLAAPDTTATTTVATTSTGTGNSVASGPSTSTTTHGKSNPNGVAKGHGSAPQPPKAGSPSTKSAAASHAAATHRKANPKAPASVAPQSAFGSPFSGAFSPFSPAASDQAATPVVKTVAKPAAKHHRTIAQTLIPNEGAVNAALRRVQTLTEGVFSGPGLIAAVFAVVIAVAGAGAAVGATRRGVS